MYTHICTHTHHKATGGAGLDAGGPHALEGDHDLQSDAHRNNCRVRDSIVTIFVWSEQAMFEVLINTCRSSTYGVRGYVYYYYYYVL